MVEDSVKLQELLKTRISAKKSHQPNDRFLVSSNLRNRTAFPVLLREVRDVNANEWTVRRRLGAAEVSCRMMATGPPLQRRHRVVRLAFAPYHGQLRALSPDMMYSKAYTSSKNRPGAAIAGMDEHRPECDP